MQDSEIVLWGNEKIVEADGGKTTVYFQKPTTGKDFMAPGSSPTFRKVRSEKLGDKLDFLSLMLALFCGTASLPHILIRYYTVKDQISARKSTVVGIAAIGFFYVLTLYLGLGAMTSGTLDVTDSNMSAPLLARSFNELLFAVISAVAFTTVLGTVSGLIMAASGAVAHDLMTNFLKIKMDDVPEGARRQDRRALRRRAGHRPRHPLREDERQLPRRLGVQHRGLGQPAGARHAALLEAHDQAGHHRRDHRRDALVAGWILAERAGVQGRLRPRPGRRRSCRSASRPSSRSRSGSWSWSSCRS